MPVGVLLIAKLPSSAAWAIGLLVGINLIMSGFAYLFLPTGVSDGYGRKKARQKQA
jgi:uncharacterized membrane protein HdeD (DUF308 family)